MGSKEAYNQAMKEGRAQAWAMNWQAAAEQYRRALHEYPDDLVARNSLAVTLYRAGNWAEALREYETVTRRNPGDAIARGRVAELYGRLGDAESAAQAYVALGELYLEQRDREKAVEAWGRVVDLFPMNRVALSLISKAASLAGEKTFQAEIDGRLARLVAEEADQSVGLNAEVEAQPERRPEIGQMVAEAGRNGIAGEDENCAQVSEATEPNGDEVCPDALLFDGDGWSAAHWEDLAVLDEAKRAAVLGGLRMSEEYLAQGKVLAAEDEYLLLVGIAPECLPVHEGLARLYVGQRRTEEAVDKYSSLALVYELRCERRRAAAMYRKVADLKPQDLTLRLRVAELLLEAGLRSEAQGEFLVVAEEYLTQGLTEDALEAYGQAIAADSGNARAHASLGRALEMDGRYEEAAGCYRRALELDPTDVSHAAALSVQLGALGDWDGVEAVFARVTDRIAEDPDSLHLVLPYYREAAARLVDNPSVSYCAGVLLRLGGWRDESRGYLEVATVGQGRRSVLSHLYLGEDALLSDDIEAAANHAREGLRLLASEAEWLSQLERDDAELRCYRLLAETGVARQEWTEAKLALGEIKRLVPDDDSTYAKLAEIHFRLGEVSSAVQEFRDLADLWVRVGEAERAVAVCQAATQLDPGNLEVRSQLADVYLRLGAVDDALTQLEDVAKSQLERGLEGEGYETLRQMLEHARGHNAQLALSIRERMARLRPNDVEVRRDLIEAYLKAGRPSQALDEARDLAESLLRAGLMGDAVSALRRVTMLNPWDTRALGQLGDALSILGEDEEAERVYERLLAIEPGNNMAKGALAAIRQRR